jgi:hypothetical protein
MEEHLSFPEALSYRQLLQLLQTAAPEPNPDGTAGGGARDALEASLEAWSRCSQELLQRLQQAGPELASLQHPRQLLALGALQAHVALGLQALASSRRAPD